MGEHFLEDFSRRRSRHTLSPFLMAWVAKEALPCCDRGACDEVQGVKTVDSIAHALAELSQNERPVTFDRSADKDGTKALVRRVCDCTLARGAPAAHTRLQTGLQVSGMELRMTVDLRACDRAIICLCCLRGPQRDQV